MSWIVYLMVGVLVVGCGMAGDGQAPGSTTTTSPNRITTSTEMTTMPTEMTTTTSLPDGLSQDVLQEIIADAADRTGMDVDDIEIVSIDSQTFNDASLGCPEAGKMYAQVLTDGFVALLDADGQELDYRIAKSGGSPVFCDGAAGE